MSRRNALSNRPDYRDLSPIKSARRRTQQHMQFASTPVDQGPSTPPNSSSNGSNSTVQPSPVVVAPISNVRSNVISNVSSVAYAFRSEYDAAYYDKVTVHTIEYIIDKSQKRTKRSWLPWLIIPLLILLPFALLATSNDFLNALCTFFLPVATTGQNKTTEFITIKKYYHYFVPSSVSSSPNFSSASVNEVLRLENLLAAVDLRLELVEDVLKKLGQQSTASADDKNLTKNLQGLQLLFHRLDKRIADLESSKQATVHLIKDEVESIKGQLVGLQQRLATYDEAQKNWKNDLWTIISKTEQQQIDLKNIDIKLKSLAAADCNCQSSLLPSAGGITKDDVDRLIREAISRYDADKTGLPDYALEPAGGAVISTRCTEVFSSYTRRQSIWGVPIPFWPNDYSPRIVIQPGLTPGECWAFSGPGYLVVRLSGLIQVTAVSYEHIPKEISPDGHIYSAPKNMEVKALSSEQDKNGTTLGKFIYDANGPPLQYFPVQTSNATPTEFIELQVTGNHGHPLYTCLYRFRVHGKRVNSGWPSFGGS